MSKPPGPLKGGGNLWGQDAWPHKGGSERPPGLLRQRKGFSPQA